MENRHQEILSEIKDMMASIRMQIEQLDAKMALLQQTVDPNEPVEEIFDLDIEIDDDLPFLPDTESDTEVEPVPDPVEEAPVEEETVLLTAPAVEEVPVAVGRKTVIDKMTNRQAWRTDMPGPPVKDVRSAIAMNDRVLFINTLFGGDPLLFHDTVTRINQMTTLDEAVECLVSEHPTWNLESDVVYRFMMAVRRKITE